ncbi:MAG: phosphatidate cytidylyltransferase [Candidatus Rokubacteria bacterium]|nr:phosphatidate cytidylyltransferase [Candidatus Rokubacteria bacterium]
MACDVGRVALVSVVVGDAAAGPSPVWKRLGSAAVLIPAFVWVTAGAPAWVFQALVVAVSALACGELARMLARAGRPVHARLTVAVGAALTASFATSLYAVTTADGGILRWMPSPELALTAGVALILSAPLWTAGPPAVESTATTLFGAVYVGWLLGYAIWLHGRADGPALVLFLAGVTWAGESAAYLVGSALGRHPLAPVLSPRKTVEGSVAQLLVSIASGVALGAWLLPACGPARAAGAGAVLGVIGQVGDLAESAIKRSVGTKDAGSLIPGHGGMLDRIDSLLFNAPALYVYALYAGCRA